MSEAVVNLRRYVPRAAASPLSWLVLLIILLACYRFSLIDRGHFYWGDERCYLPASDLVDAVARGDFDTALRHLYRPRSGVPAARPGFVVVSVLPVLAQRVVGKLAGINRDLPQYYDIASAFNVLVTLGVTVCLYALGCAWTKRPWFALLIAMVYSLLVNANVWVRHMVPYQESLLLFLLALWLLSTGPAATGGLPARAFPGRITGSELPVAPGTWRIVLAGLLTAFAYSCYPGHYAYVIIIGAVLLATSRRWLRSAATFGLSFGFVIGVFELLAHLAGRSYIMDMRRLAPSVTMGDRREGYVFAWRYLRDVEGLVGVLLFGLFCGFVLFALWRRQVRIPRTIRVAIIAAIGAYLFHATAGLWTGRMVLYGRILMLYLPLVIAGAVLTLIHMCGPGLRRVGVCALVAASGYSFVDFALSYNRVVYPIEFLQETMTKLDRDIVYPADALWRMEGMILPESLEQLDPALVNIVDTRPDGADTYAVLSSHEEARQSNARFIGVNLKFMWYFRKAYHRFTPPKGYRLVAEALHPEVFRGTGYEGRKPWERDRIRRRQYKMRIYERVHSQEQVTYDGPRY
ncbi:MAG: hypothetical protein WBE26_18805 [Phycisphaerae bacterium]